MEMIFFMRKNFNARSSGVILFLYKSFSCIHRRLQKFYWIAIGFLCLSGWWCCSLAVPGIVCAMPDPSLDDADTCNAIETSITDFNLPGFPGATVYKTLLLENAAFFK
jgi:hypothetical protein